MCTFDILMLIFFERGNVIMATKKTAEKETKTTAAKTTKTTKAKAKEPVVNVTLQFQGKDTSVKEIINTVKNAYKDEAIETIDIYVQPEKNCAYFVVNGKASNEPITF